MSRRFCDRARRAPELGSIGAQCVTRASGQFGIGARNLSGVIKSCMRRALSTSEIEAIVMGMA